MAASTDNIQPGYNALAITPDDDDTLAVSLGGEFAITQGLYVGGAGNVAVVMAGGGAVTFTALAAGVIHPLQVTHVKATNTTATTIVGIFTSRNYP